MNCPLLVSCYDGGAGVYCWKGYPYEQTMVELFPDDLRAEMEKIRKIAVDKTRKVSYRISGNTSISANMSV